MKIVNLIMRSIWIIGLGVIGLPLLAQEATPKIETGEIQQVPGEKAFHEEVQKALEAVVAGNHHLQSLALHVQLDLWPGTSGRFLEVELVTKSGDANVDIDLKNAILLDAKLSGPPPEGLPIPMRVTLDTGGYQKEVQQAVQAAVAANGKFKDFFLNVQLHLWPGPGGRVLQVELVSSTGDPNRDIDLKNTVLLDTKLPEVTPDGQPVPLLVTVTSGEPSPGQQAVNKAVQAWQGPLPKTLPTTMGPIGDNPPSQIVVVNLINRLVQRGVMTKEDAADLIKQAEQDAENSKQQAAAQAAASAPPAGAEEAVGVNYIPDEVKAEMREQIKNEVMTQAREENWTSPNAMPDWLSRLHPMADFRVRYEFDHYPNGNASQGAFTNFNAINGGNTPYAISNDNLNFPPLQNVDQTRERLRLRLRFGAEADLLNGLTAGVRIGTGQDDSPVSENQSFGLANNAQGGNFSKYAIWLDQAYLRYEYGQGTDFDIIGTVGRFENPFMHTTLLWANDLNFEGVYGTVRYNGFDNVTPFLTGGAFPIYNTDYNFASNQPSKFKSEDKWLYAAQIGTEWKVNEEVSVKGAMAYYDFDNIEGHLSDPYVPLSAADAGNTDDSRPSFAQNGNTYRVLRDITPVTGTQDQGGNQDGTINQYQYFGLATAFREAAITGQVDYSHFDPFHLRLRGEAVQNLAFDKSAINQIAVNNRGSTDGTTTGGFVGGDYGYLVDFTVGQPILNKLWDWNVTTSYRYVESDATVDAFNDSDFGANMAGTNLQGYTIGGSMALSSHLWFTIQFMSANSIEGPTYKNDLFQFDINAKF